MRKLIGASLGVLLAVPATGLAETVRVGCEYGGMTLARLADGECLSHVAVPTPRPDRVAPEEASNSTDAKPRTYRFIETPDPRTGKLRAVRVVGPVYLPEDSQKIELRREAPLVSDPFNAAFNSVASFLGFGSAHADEPEPSSTVTAEDAGSAKQRLEAMADLRIHAAHN